MADDMSVQSPEPTFLALSPAELEIAEAAKDVLGGLTPIERLHRPNGADLDDGMRRELGTLGWFGLVAPEESGGSGLSPVEFALFFREVGRVCGPLDILTQSLAVLVAAGDPTLRDPLLSGESGAVLAAPDGDNLRILGNPTVGMALYAEHSEARLIDISDLELNPRPPLDRGTSMRIAQSSKGTPLAIRGDGDTWAIGQLGVAAMLVGVAEATLDLIVEYAKIRETFGRKIGSYQAVRHPCADMAMRAEAARSQLWYAAASLKAQKSDAQAHLDAAKHLANTAAVVNADVCIQLHGGIGVTDEHHAHLFLKRALLLGQVFGSKRTLLARLLNAVLED